MSSAREQREEYAEQGARRLGRPGGRMRAREVALGMEAKLDVGAGG